MSVPLLIGTRNEGKVREMRRLLGTLPFRLVFLSRESLGFEPPEDPEETGESFLANAGIKARCYHEGISFPTLAEDSGLEVDALDGAPGVRSARWLGVDTPYEEKNRRLLELVEGRERGARYRSAMAVAARGRIVFRATGVVEGRIAAAPRGSGGFGYDPVFETASGLTMAELSPAEKERISHRGAALRRVVRFLESAARAESL